MNAGEVSNQLSLYLGLDDETIKENVLPHLESMTSRAELQDYLTGLLGNDTAQASFIQAYANGRFPLSNTTKAASVRKPGSSQAPGAASSPGAYVTSAHTPQIPKSRTPTSAHASASASTSSTRAQQAFPSTSSNAKLQVVQAPTVNLVAPVASLPSTSAYTLDHAASGQSIEAAQKRLRQIGMQMRAARGQSKEIACFCQAQVHPLSPVIPMCPRCLLVLCDLNVPYSRACPSCSYTPLADDHRLAAYISRLEAEKSDIDEKEKERIRFESEAEERARRAIQFPDLQDRRSPSPSGPQGHAGTIAYARKAGGGPQSHQQHVDQMYRNAQAREQAIAAGSERRVLSINSKTKKVQYQTTKPAAKAKSTSNSKENLEKLKKATKIDNFEDERKPFVDEKDDGIAKQSVTPLDKSQQPLRISWPPRQGSGLVYTTVKASSSQTHSPVPSVAGAEDEVGSTSGLNDAPGAAP